MLFGFVVAVVVVLGVLVIAVVVVIAFVVVVIALVHYLSSHPHHDRFFAQLHLADCRNWRQLERQRRCLKYMLFLLRLLLLL